MSIRAAAILDNGKSSLYSWDALDYLQAKYKGGGKFTQEALFEHLSSPLREDKKLMEYNEGHPKRKGRGSRSKGRDEKKKEAMQ